MDRLNSKHFVFVILGVAVVSIKTYPTLFTKLGGRDTWIALIIASLMIVLFCVYVLWVCKKEDCFNIYQIYTEALGKVMGNLMILLFLLTVFLSVLESAAVEANAMHTNFLLLTPHWVFLMASTLAGLYIVKKGESAVVTVTIISITLISLSGMLLAALTQKYKEYKYLFPILSDGITGDFIWSVLKLLGAYGSISVILLYLTNMKDKSKLIKNSIFGLLFLVQIQIVSMIGNITTFGIDRLNQLVYPKLIQTQIISHFGFLEAGELFVMLQIVGGWFMKYVLTLFAFIKLLELMKLNSKYNAYIVSVIAFFVSYFVTKNLFNLFNALNYLMYIQLINYVFIPFIIFTIFALKKKRKMGKP